MLYKERLRMIQKKMPKAIVFENVKGMLSAKHTGGRNLGEAIVEDLSCMNGAGYDVARLLASAADCGAPPALAYETASAIMEQESPFSRPKKRQNLQRSCAPRNEARRAICRSSGASQAGN